MDTLWVSITALMMAAGFLGTFLPVLPGIPLIYAGYVFYGLVTGWRDYGLGAMVIWGLVTGLIAFVEFYAGSIGAKKYGASKYAVWGSIAGGIAGSIVAGLPGLIVGPFVGAVIGEIFTGRPLMKALRSGWGTLLGLIAGSLLKVTVAIAMIGTFFWWIV